MCYSRKSYIQGSIKNENANYYPETERENDDEQRSQNGYHH